MSVRLPKADIGADRSCVIAELSTPTSETGAIQGAAVRLDAHETPVKTLARKLTEGYGSILKRAIAMLISISEAARRWGVGRETIARRRRKGEITFEGKPSTIDVAEMIRVFGEACEYA